MHHQTPTPICPHCGHEFSHDDMEQEDAADLFALAPQEETTDIQCPICDQAFVVKGGYTPHYTTAFVEEQLDP